MSTTCVLCDIVEQLLLDNGVGPEVKARSAVTLSFAIGVASGIKGEDVIPPICIACMALMDGALQDTLGDQVKVPK